MPTDDDIRLLDAYYSHRPGPDCDRFTPHVHAPDGSIYMDAKPGMYETPGLACRALLFWGVIGAGLWAVIIAAILKALGR